MDLIYSNDLFVCNIENTPTFEAVTRGRVRSSIVDITLASGSILEYISDWKVNLEACPSSQHNAIEFHINYSHAHTQIHAISSPAEQTNNRPTSTFLYKSNKACWPLFKEALHLRMTMSNVLDIDISSLSPEGLEEVIDRVSDIINSACRYSMRIAGRGAKYKPPWWTEELEALKQEVINTHRMTHLHKHRNVPLDDLLIKLATKKTEYSNKLRYESTKHFKEFCNLQTKENVWSLTNRLLKANGLRRAPVTLNLGNGYTNNAIETADAILNHFYPHDLPDTEPRHHQLRNLFNTLPHTQDDPPFSGAEILEYLKQMNSNRAPGVDNLTSDICSQFASDYTKLLTDIFNRCLSLRYFPKQWKVAYVKIIPKPGKMGCRELSSFRPIGLLPVFGKVLETLFIKRVTHWAGVNNKINNKQFGFTKHKNSTQAINTALKIIKQAKENKKLGIAVSLDIRAAFDNAWWPSLLQRLRHIGCPVNIFGLIDNYVRDREVLLDYAGVRASKIMSKG
ncbi:unnamed protein product [Parnassius mnemosyne]|uniref:Reverse transcriptase domain-containing protein n=1 Tax=Parnassius mnemosyne TaxID=213953 RepID=A0AAV1LDN1_9NEOP